MDQKKYNELINLFSNNNDIIYQESSTYEIPFLHFYVPEMFSIINYISYFFPRINNKNYQVLDTVMPGIFVKLSNDDPKELFKILFEGNLIIIINYQYVYQVVVPSKKTRAIENSALDPINLYTSQEGFIEDIKINLTLIRKRLKSTPLIVKDISVGEKYPNKLSIICEESNNEYLQHIIETINNIKPSLALSINTIAKPFQKYSLVPKVFYTGSPEVFSEAIAKGRTGILLDNSPIALIIPADFSLFSTPKNEVDAPSFFALTTRLFIYFFAFISLFLLGFCVAVISYHPSSLTLFVLANIKLTERGTSLPLFFEIIAILVLFDFLRYATSRSSSKYIQNIILILGGLFIGQNAVNSGLIGSLVLLLTALSYLSCFAFTNNTFLITSFSLLRLFILILSYTFGLWGFLSASIIVILYLSSENSMGVNYFSPIIPFHFKHFKELFLPTMKGDVNSEENNR